MDRRKRARRQQRLRALVARGYGLQTCEILLRVPRRTLRDWAARLRLKLRPHWLSREKDQAILELLAAGERPRAIMRAVGVSFDAVARRRALQTLQRFRNLEGRTPLPAGQWRCRCGLKLQIDHCLRCRTERPRGKAFRPSERPADRS